MVGIVTIATVSVSAEPAVSKAGRAGGQRSRIRLARFKHRASVFRMRCNRLTNSDWAEIRTAHASGIGLRELARNMGIPAGTVLARSKREGWTRQIQTAKALACQPTQPLARTTTDAVRRQWQNADSGICSAWRASWRRRCRTSKAWRPARCWIESKTLTGSTGSGAAPLGWMIARAAAE